MTDVELQTLKQKNLILESQVMNFESRLSQSETAKFELTKLKDAQAIELNTLKEQNIKLN